MKLMGRIAESPVCSLAAQNHADCMWTDETLLDVSLFFQRMYFWFILTPSCVSFSFGTATTSLS